jgi:hypothetical protein
MWDDAVLHFAELQARGVTLAAWLLSLAECGTAQQEIRGISLNAAGVQVYCYSSI